MPACAGMTVVKSIARFSGCSLSKARRRWRQSDDPPRGFNTAAPPRRPCGSRGPGDEARALRPLDACFRRHDGREGVHEPIAPTCQDIRTNTASPLRLTCQVHRTPASPLRKQGPRGRGAVTTVHPIPAPPLPQDREPSAPASDNESATDVLPQVAPPWVSALDQFQLPSTLPPLQLLLSQNG